MAFTILNQKIRSFTRYIPEEIQCEIHIYTALKYVPSTSLMARSKYAETFEIINYKVKKTKIYSTRLRKEESAELFYYIFLFILKKYQFVFYITFYPFSQHFRHNFLDPLFPCIIYMLSLRKISLNRANLKHLFNKKYAFLINIYLRLNKIK